MKKLFVAGMVISIMLAGCTASAQPYLSVEEESAPEIVYETVSVTDMMHELNENAYNAEQKYNDAYVEVTGMLGNIDSDGKYFTLYKNEMSIIGVHCKITDKSQLEELSVQSKGNLMTVRGQIVSVGEVLGYTLSITEIR